MAAGAPPENRLPKHVDHLHEHSPDPERPGYSIEMRPGPPEEFEFPMGNARTVPGSKSS